MKFQTGDIIERVADFRDWAPKGYKSVVDDRHYTDKYGSKVLYCEDDWVLVGQATNIEIY